MENPKIQKLKLTDYFQIVTSFLFALVGIALLLRSIKFGIPVQILMVAGGFLALGTYRLIRYYRYFKSRNN